MSKGKWKRCPHTGLSLTAITDVSESVAEDVTEVRFYDVPNVPLRRGLLGVDAEGEPVQNADGTLRPEAFPECDVFDWATAARLAAGPVEGKAVNVARWKERMIAAWPECLFHPLEEDYDGNPLMDGEDMCYPLAIACNSKTIIAWGKRDRIRRAENSRRNLKRGTTRGSGKA